MTNTIPNVPRELKPCPFCGGKTHAIAENAATRQPEVVMCLACLGEIEGAGAIDKWSARTLSAPSTAGVDGLDVVAWLCEWMGDKCGGVYSGLSKTSLEGLRRSQGEDVLIVSDEPLCRLSDATAIIDGLRVECKRLQQELRLRQSQIESSGRIAERAQRFSVLLRTERDQQARRIGELEGLLRHAQKQVPTGSGLHMRIDSALSADGCTNQWGDGSLQSH